MSGFPVLSAATPRLAVPSRKSYRAASGSPTRQKHYFQQHADDLISQLTPANAIRVLRHPSGTLKECLESATASEQSFAMRAALAARNIQDWLDELLLWPWPDSDGSTGFETPHAAQPWGHRTASAPVATDPERLSSSSPPSSPCPLGCALPTSGPVTPKRQISCPLGRPVEAEDDSRSLWLGSLPASDVALYESRIAEIDTEIDALEIEDLKRHVLHHHIFPLTPPDTPSIDGRLRAALSTSTTTFTKMDDLSAVVAAIVLQTLPLLSKLTRLLQVWHIRLVVVKRIPTLHDSLNAAETAIKAAWKAARLNDDNRNSDPSLSEVSVFHRGEFTVMRAFIEEKVSKAAQITDFMLDSLDGLEDTIPDHWIDRIDKAEHEYEEWVAACERKIRGSEWRGLALNKPALPPPQQASPAVPSMTIKYSQVNDESSSLHTPEHSQTTLELLKPHDSDSDSTEEPELPQVLRPRSASDQDEIPVDLDSSTDDLTSDVLSSRSSVDTLLCHLSDMCELVDGRDLQASPGGYTDPSSSPPDFRASVRSTITFSDMPTVAENPGEESSTATRTSAETSFVFDDITNDEMELPQEADGLSNPGSPYSFTNQRMSFSSDDDQLQQQIHEILESIPARIHLSSQPSPKLNHLNPPDFKLPRKPKSTTDNTRSLSSMSTRSVTPSFLLAPAYARSLRPRQQRGNQDIKLYHLSRSTGEAPIKLFIRLVGENGERVMVRVGGGWADLSEYLKEYASHHSRRPPNGEEAKIEVRDLPPTLTMATAVSRNSSRLGSRTSPPSRPGSALDSPRAMQTLTVRKTRRVTGTAGDEASKPPRTPLAAAAKPAETPSSGTSTRSRSSSRLSWTEEDSTLGMSGPKAKNITMSDESKAWVESVTERVRIVSGERRVSDQVEVGVGKFGRIDKVGGTKRLFRKN